MMNFIKSSRSLPAATFKFSLNEKKIELFCIFYEWLTDTDTIYVDQDFVFCSNKI